MNGDEEQASPGGDHGGIRRQYQQLLVDFDASGYFDQHPPASQDRRTHSGLVKNAADKLGEPVDLRFLPHRQDDHLTVVKRVVGKRQYGGHDPYRSIDELSNDEFYELIEVFHDLIARPRAREGDRFIKLSAVPGQRLYRWRVNRLIEQNQVALRMAEEGEFVGRLLETTDDGRTELDERVRDQATDEHQESKIDHALGQFQCLGATDEDKRSAIKTLVGILEEHRSLLKDDVLSKDEGALFHIANQFAKRHQSESQKSNYDPVFLDWVFWWYLATVELIQRLLQRQQGGQP